MKKIIIGLLLLVGCTYNSSNIPIKYGKSETKQHTPERVTMKYLAPSVYLYIIDNCEYIFIKVGYGAGLTHKGDCKNHNKDGN